MEWLLASLASPSGGALWTDARRFVSVAGQGRSVEVPRANAGAALFCFEELCGRELGAADYKAALSSFSFFLFFFSSLLLLFLR